MKIVFLSFYSGHVNRGVETATGALAQKLSTRHQVIVFQAGERLTENIPTIKLLHISNWPVDTNRSFLRRFYLDYYSRQIVRFTLAFISYLRREKYDVVIPTNGGWQVVLVRLATWILGKKMLVQGNAGIGRDDFWQALWHPDYFIAISPNGEAWIKKKATWLQSAYIPYGVDLGKMNRAPKIHLPLNKPIVLSVAALAPYKRVDFLIKAMALVPNASLLLIGQGPEEEKLRKLGQRLLGKRFLIKTDVLHNELFSYYKCADLFTMPSRSTEALGIVYIEALAAGLPVVAPDDWRREIIGDAGAYVDPENTQAYAAAIKEGLERSFGDLPKKQAQKYSWEKIAAKYEEILEKL